MTARSTETMDQPYDVVCLGEALLEVATEARSMIAVDYGAVGVGSIVSLGKGEVMASARDVGLLAIRIGIGGALASHGAQKLFGWFGGGGPKSTGEMMESMGFRPGARSAALAGLGEAGGGLLLALGLATRPAAAAVMGTMTTAGSVHAEKGFFNTAGGYELPAVYGLVASALAVTGPGRLSIDHLTGDVLNRPWMGMTGFAGALSAAIYLIQKRRRVTQAGAEVG